MFEFSQRSKKNMEGVDNRLIDIANIAIEISPIDFGVPEDGGVRTDEKQNELFNLKRSTKDGYIKRSKHQPSKKDGKGKALDVYAYINGKGSWDPIHLTLIAGVFFAVAAKFGVKIRWGGTFGSNEFKGWDPGHFEIVEE